jgi:hypothetical protein
MEPVLPENLQIGISYSIWYIPQDSMKAKCCVATLTDISGGLTFSSIYPTVGEILIITDLTDYKFFLAPSPLVEVPIESLVVDTKYYFITPVGYSNIGIYRETIDNGVTITIRISLDMADLMLTDDKDAFDFHFFECPQ